MKNLPANLLKSLDLWLIEKKHSIFCCSSAAFLPSLFSAALDCGFCVCHYNKLSGKHVYIACHICICTRTLTLTLILIFIFSRMDFLSLDEYNCGPELWRLKANNNIGQSQIFICFICLYVCLFVFNLKSLQ